MHTATALQACAWIEEKHPVNLQVQDSLQVQVDEKLMEKALCNLLELWMYAG